MVRLGLCCVFVSKRVRFRHTTARYAGGLPEAERRAFLRELTRHNAQAIADAATACAELGIGAFRAPNDVVPLVTHPELGLSLAELDEDGSLVAALRAAGDRARALDVRLSFHPDQFVVLNSARPEVVALSSRELEQVARVAELVGAAQVTLHGGGATGGKPEAARRLVAGIEGLSARARGLLALENDDVTWTVEDLLPVVEATGVRLVYDVHHHRCNPDGLGVEEATAAAVATWGGAEAWAHVSSPAEGWDGPKPRRHADHIDPADLPEAWRDLRLTVDVEAKAKEVAVGRVADVLEARGWTLQRPRVP